MILAFSQNSLGKQFRNDLMMLRGYCTPSKKTTKQTNKQTQKQKTKQKQNKTKTTKQNQKKNMFCALPQNHQRLFEKYYMHLTINCPSRELKDSIKI